MVLRTTVHCFPSGLEGEGDWEVKLLALYGEVMTFGNFGVYLFHLLILLRPLTYREIKP